jgi:hypothetical protein
MARTGLRMMPTFPSSPLKFRTAGFPRYGFKAGCQTGPSRVAPDHRVTQFATVLRARQVRRDCLRSESESPDWLSTAVRATLIARPQRPSLRFGLCCPGPSTLNRPHPPHSPAHRVFTALRLIPDAFAVCAHLGDPRVVPCFRCAFCLGMSSSTTPESSAAPCTQFLRRRRWLSPLTDGLSTPNLSHHPLRVGLTFRGFAGSPLLQPAELLASLADPTGLPQPTETFTSGLPTGWSPFPPPDMTTVATGQFPPAGLTPARTSASIAAPVSCQRSARKLKRRAPVQGRLLPAVA